MEKNYALAQSHLSALEVDNLTPLQQKKDSLILLFVPWNSLMRMLLFSWKILAGISYSLFVNGK